MKLFHCPNTRSLRPLWLLEELGIAYDLEYVDLFKGEGQTEKYKLINPNGTVPTLDDNGTIIFEAGAICMYLTDKFPESRLAPATNTPERALYYQWMFFVPGTMEPPLWHIFLHTHILPEDQRIPSVIEYSRKQFNKVASILNEALSDRTYILGDQFSTADIMVASTLRWFPEFITEYANLQTYSETLSKRSACQRAYAIDNARS